MHTLLIILVTVSICWTSLISVCSWMKKALCPYWNDNTSFELWWYSHSIIFELCGYTISASRHEHIVFLLKMKRKIRSNNDFQRCWERPNCNNFVNKWNVGKIFFNTQTIFYALMQLYLTNMCWNMLEAFTGLGCIFIQFFPYIHMRPTRP